MGYMLRRGDLFPRFLVDGRICLTTMPPKGRYAVSPWAESRGAITATSTVFSVSPGSKVSVPLSAT